MKLTQVERQILYNQNQILSILCPEEKDLFELNMTILQNGYASEYDEVITVYEEVSKDDCRFVYDVLSMYRELYFSYQKLDDKSDISAADVSFQGFDGNEEGKYYAFASFLLNDKKLFSEFSKVDTNSHANRKEIYKRMLDVYNKLGKKYSNSLNKEEIISIINARHI